MCYPSARCGRAQLSYFYRATREVNGCNTATDNAHVDVQELAKPINVSGLAQANANTTAKDHSKDVKFATLAAQKPEIGREPPVMTRSETADSVQIVGDVMA